MARVELEKVSKIYPGGVRAVNAIDLQIKDQEFIVLVGPSGCGKSTTLRMVAGLEEISDGEIRIGERVVNNIPPKNRDIAMVFQNYALYPHMSVYKNMAFGLKLRKMPKQQIHQRVMEAAKILDIEHLLERKPKALSGGQRQRIVVMKDGIIHQNDTPLKTYSYPVNRFVAGFIGMPPMNFFEGAIKSVDGRLVFEEGKLKNARVAGMEATNGGTKAASARKELTAQDEPLVMVGELTLPG